jgi:hypothetical protein
MPAASIDNFWLFEAIRYGLPAALFMLVAFFSVFLAVAFRKGLDHRSDEYRTGFLIAMTFFFLIGWTVHFWDTAYVLFLFLMGSGVWMLDAQAKEKPFVQEKRFEAVRSVRSERWRLVGAPQAAAALGEPATPKSSLGGPKRVCAEGEGLAQSRFKRRSSSWRR